MWKVNWYESDSTRQGKGARRWQRCYHQQGPRSGKYFLLSLSVCSIAYTDLSSERNVSRSQNRKGEAQIGMLVSTLSSRVSSLTLAPSPLTLSWLLTVARGWSSSSLCSRTPVYSLLVSRHSQFAPLTLLTTGPARHSTFSSSYWWSSVTWLTLCNAGMYNKVSITTTFLSDYVKIQVFSKYHYNSLLGRSEYL